MREGDVFFHNDVYRSEGGIGERSAIRAEEAQEMRHLARGAGRGHAGHERVGDQPRLFATCEASHSTHGSKPSPLVLETWKISISLRSARARCSMASTEQFT